MNRIVFFSFFFFKFLFSVEIYGKYDVLSAKSSKLVLQNSGIVSKIYVDIGDYIKKGDKLLSLDVSSYKIALDLAENDLKLARLSKKHFNEVLNRLNKVASFNSKQSLDDARFNYEKSVIEENKAFLNVKNIKENIKKSILVAPFDGVISDKFVQLGQGVVAISSVLFVVDTYPDVKLKISFDEKFAKNIKIGNEFHFLHNDKKYIVKINKIYPNVDIKTQKIYAEALASGLKIGSYGEGYLVDK